MYERRGMKQASILCFSPPGKETARRLREYLKSAYPDWNVKVFAKGRFAAESEPDARPEGLAAAETATEHADVIPLTASLADWGKQHFAQDDCLIFIGSAGIAVRTIGPLAVSKKTDPAVLVVDDRLQYVIPILSGHLGGANEIAKTLAEGLQAVPVLTTATDGRQVFAVDTWAKAHSCAVLEPHYIKYVSGALLRGETVGVRSDFPIDGLLPARIDLKKDAESGFTIGFRTDAQPFAHTLHLMPRIAYLGIGCRKGTSADAIEQTVQAALASAKLPWQAICGAASILICSI